MFSSGLSHICFLKHLARAPEQHLFKSTMVADHDKESDAIIKDLGAGGPFFWSFHHFVNLIVTSFDRCDSRIINLPHIRP